MAARDRMVAAHPTPALHRRSPRVAERDVDELAAFLDKFPTPWWTWPRASASCSTRASRTGERVRRFFIKYQDRVLYGSDMAQAPDQDGAALAKRGRRRRMHWRYFNTADSFRVADLDKPVRASPCPRPWWTSSIARTPSVPSPAPGAR
jgi:hypothetical protein